jgi:catechol 2,3-dioxygenase-like lactoylglutathione lyase family enzyme
VTARNYYHVGILVDDIVAARERFAAVTGLGFTEIQTVHIENFQDDRGSRPLDITLCYSQEGPPFLELVQSDPAGGIFGRRHGEGLHHLGFHRPEAGEWLEHSPPGLTREAARFRTSAPSCLASFFTAPGGLHGVRLEIIDESGRPGFFQWLRTLGTNVDG